MSGVQTCLGHGDGRLLQMVIIEHMEQYDNETILGPVILSMTRAVAQNTDRVVITRPSVPTQEMTPSIARK